MVFQCRASVADGGPTLKHRRVNVSRLLGKHHFRAKANRSNYSLSSEQLGGGPRVVVSIAAFHARVRGSVLGLGGLKETKMFLPHPRVKVSIEGSLRDREVACSASDRQGSNFESCVWRTVSYQSSHHPQEVLLAQFSLYVHKSGLKPDSFPSYFQVSSLSLHDGALVPISGDVEPMLATIKPTPGYRLASEHRSRIEWLSGYPIMARTKPGFLLRQYSPRTIASTSCITAVWVNCSSVESEDPDSGGFELWPAHAGIRSQ